MSDEQTMPDVIYANKDQDCYRQGKWQDCEWAYMPNDFTLIGATPYLRCPDNIDPEDAVVVSKQLCEDIGDDQRDSEATIATLTAERDALRAKVRECLNECRIFHGDSMDIDQYMTDDLAALAQLKEQADD